MTTVITRYFESVTTARAVKYELVHRQRFSLRILDYHTSAIGLADALIEQHVSADTARAYEDKMAAGGGAVILVRAGFKPLGVAQIARDVMRDMGAADMGGLSEETYVKDKLNHNLSIMQGSPLMMSRPRDPDTTTFHMADWPFGLILRRPPFSTRPSPTHMRMTDIEMPLTVRMEPFTKSIFPRHARMADFPIPLLSKRKPFTGSIIGKHARMANFPIPLISRRKPKDRFAFPRHRRMANWPFPHLINGKTGTNALMPGSPRMANFPIGLLSNRKPNTASIFPRHARMANFPIGLISKRTPFTGSAIPRHGRMANAILPLTVPREGRNGFSFSKMLGLPTVIRR